MPHQRLLFSIKAHGIGNGMINRVEKWLIDRRQRVIVDGEVSNCKSVLSGVPQRSELGPILFLIYINKKYDVRKKGDRKERNNRESGRGKSQQPGRCKTEELL